MPFNYLLSDELSLKLEVIKKKNKPLAIEFFKKMDEILSRDNQTIDFYKNMRSPENQYKRVHIGHFVIKFKVMKEENLIIFADLIHHE